MNPSISVKSFILPAGEGLKRLFGFSCSIEEGVLTGAVAVYPAHEAAGEVVQDPLSIHRVDNPTGKPFKSIEDFTAFVNQYGEAIANALNK